MSGIKDAGITTITYQRSTTPGGDIAPLTTMFTYAASCREQWLQRWPNDSDSITYSSLPTWGTYFSSCQPGGRTQFSPGICPSGHHIATISEYSDGRREKLWVAACCYDGLTISDGSHLCIGSLTSRLIVFRPETRTYTEMFGTISEDMITTIDYNPNENTTEVSRGTKVACPLFITWQASDLSVFDPPYASALAARLKIDFTPTDALELVSATPVSKPNFPTQTLPVFTSEYTEFVSASDLPEPPQQFSKGTTAGISVGATLGAAAVALAIFLIYKRTRRRKQELHQPEEESGYTDVPEVDGNQETDRKEPYGTELETRVINELPSPIAELDGAGVWKEGRDIHLASQHDLPASLRAGQAVEE